MRRVARESALAALRVLLPTWRFFDDVGFGLELAARVGTDASMLGAWRRLFPPAARPRRGIQSVLLDAEGNLQLAHRALLDRLASDLCDLTDADDPRALPSYVQVLALTREMLGALALPDGARHLQFQLVQPAEAGAREALLCSAVHPLRDP